MHNKRIFSLKGEQQRLQVLFLLPLIVSLLVLIILPMISLFGLSFTNYNITKPRFAITGLQNYTNLFRDDNFVNAAKNTVFMVFFTVLIQMVLGVVAAIAIQRMKHFRGIVQALIVVPMVSPPVIIGLIWRILLIPKYGGVDALLYGLGITNTPAWLEQPLTAKWVIVLISVWEWMPFVILFVLAALDSLPESPFEAAKIDGADFLQEIFYLTLPMLKSILSFVLVFRVVEGLKIFPLVFSLTKGGPGRATEELTYFAYSEGFIKFKVGYASASSMVMFIILVILIVLFYGHKSKKNIA